MKPNYGFKKTYVIALTALMLIALGIGIAGCSVPGFVIQTPAIEPIVQVTPPAGATGDMHFIQADDYFIFDEPLGQNPWNRVWLGKMQTAPTPETQNKAKFLFVQNGASEWVTYWVKTRPAVSSDLVLGKEVYFFDNMGDADIYVAPTSNNEARTYDWAQSRITDTSEAYRGFITVGGGYKISLSNLRVAI